MKVEQEGDGLGRDLGSIAGENDDVVVVLEGGLSDHEGVSGAALFGLQNKIYAGGGDGGADAVGFVADDGEDIIRRDDTSGGGDDVRKQGLAANFVEDFWQLRFQACAFAGGHDGNGDVRGI